MAARRDFVQENIANAAHRRPQNRKPHGQSGNIGGGRKAFGGDARHNDWTHTDYKSLYTDTKAVQTDDILDMKFLMQAVEKCQANIDEEANEKISQKDYALRKIPRYYVETKGRNDRKLTVSETGDLEKCICVSSDEKQRQEGDSCRKLFQQYSVSRTEPSPSPCNSNEGMLRKEAKNHNDNSSRIPKLQPASLEPASEESTGSDC